VLNVLGEYENGIYKSVSFLGLLPLSLSVVLNTSFLPKYSKLYTENKIAEIKKSMIKLTKILFALTALGLVIAIVFGKFALSIIFNSEIANKGNYLLPFVVLATMIYVNAVLAITALQAAGKEGYVRNLAIFQGLSFFVSSTILIHYLDVVILPILLLIINAIFFSLNYYKAYKLD
jgi:O-antigen/teichoic acid export membrane protein